jgi:hypothetical protein
MAQPLVMGDKIQGQCTIHQVPNPASGAPQPSPAPLPFSAPLLQGLEPTVTAGGKPIATTSSQEAMCAQVPGQPLSTVTDVTVA